MYKYIFKFCLKLNLKIIKGNFLKLGLRLVYFIEIFGCVEIF